MRRAPANTAFGENLWPRLGVDACKAMQAEQRRIRTIAAQAAAVPRGQQPPARPFTRARAGAHPRRDEPVGDEVDGDNNNNNNNNHI